MPRADRDVETSEMFAYYDARVDGYDDFYQGKGAAIGPLSRDYPIDTATIGALLSSFGHGDVLDLGCGTGFWLSTYGRNSRSITLVDQSAPALARCAQRVDALALQHVARIIRGDIFDVPLADSGFDACVLGFILSHLTDPQIDDLFRRLHRTLRPRADLAVIDSAWTEARRPYCQRRSFERRVLPDGGAFMIRKRYIDRKELEALLDEQGFHVRSAYVGNVFIGVVASRL
ncbi:MAG TPA: class I SAM-dependent methyltransferase [Vicinamibacterales bacterium]